jgi:hypothetical protein
MNTTRRLLLAQEVALMLNLHATPWARGVGFRIAGPCLDNPFSFLSYILLHVSPSVNVTSPGAAIPNVTILRFTTGRILPNGWILITNGTNRQTKNLRALCASVASLTACLFAKEMLQSQS